MHFSVDVAAVLTHQPVLAQALGFFHAAAHTAEQRPVQRTIGVADFGHTVRILILQSAVFASLETFSYTSIFKMLVLTFYFNKYGLW